MDSLLKPSQLQGKDICFLLDIEYYGVLYRFSTFPIDIEDTASNQTIRYIGGLSDPDINQQTQIVGFNPEANKISIELIFPSVNWISEWTKGRVFDSSVCQLSIITAKDHKTTYTMQSRVSLFKGAASGAIFGTPDKPQGHIAFSIENDLVITDRKIIQEYQYLEISEFINIWSPSEGKIQPFVFGSPGSYPRPLSDGFDFLGRDAATPAYVIEFTSAIIRFLIAYDLTESGSVRVYDSRGGYFENPIETDIDSNGQIYSYVALDGTTPEEFDNFDTSGDTDIEYWTDWTPSNGSVLSPYSNEAINGAGDICIYFLEKSGLDYDFEAWSGVRLFLNKYKFAGYINAPDATWFEWLKESIIEYLPIEVVNGANGLRPLVNLYFTSDYINPSHHISDNGDFQIITGLQPLDTEVINKINMFYCWSGIYQRFNAVLRFKPDMDLTKNDLANRVPSQIAKMSLEQYGLQEKTLELYHVYDLDTALRIGHDKLRLQAFGAMAIEVSAAPKFGYLDLGDILSLSSEALGFDNYKCQIVSKSWQDNRWRFIIHLENNSLINPNQ